MRLREVFNLAYNPEGFLHKLGALKFSQGVFKEEQRTPHYEMDKAIEMFELRPQVNSGVRQIARFIIGKEISMASADQRSSDFGNKWLEQRPTFGLETFNFVISSILCGNCYLEPIFKKAVNGDDVLDMAYNLNDASRIYINLDAQSEKEWYIFRVPIEVRIFREVKPKFWRINYVSGSYLFREHIWGIAVAKKDLWHLKTGWSRDGIYGRSFLASAVEDGQILMETLKNWSIIARYRALGKKIISIGTEENPATVDDIDTLEEQMKRLDDEDHIILNKQFKSEPLSFIGENDPMQTQIDFLRKDISSGLVPNFITPWNSEVNRATAGEAKIPFQLEIDNMRTDIIDFLNRTVIGELRKAYPWLAEDLSFQFGMVDLESKEQKMGYAQSLYGNSVITLNELRKVAGFDTVEGGDKFISDVKPPEQYFEGGESVSFKEGLSDGYWKKKFKVAGSFIKVRDVGGKKVRMVKSDSGYGVFDGGRRVQNFLLDERKVANLFFDTYVKKLEKARTIFDVNRTPEDDIHDELMDKLTDDYRSVVVKFFDKLKRSKVNRETKTFSKKAVDDLDNIFAKFNAKLGGAIADSFKKLATEIKVPTEMSLDTVEASPEAKKKTTELSRLLKKNFTSQLKTFNQTKQQDIKRVLVGGIAAGKKTGDIEREIKDQINIWKTKPNPQDWKIDRIVRTELGRASNVMKLRKWQEMGFIEFEWITMADEIVRPEHAKRHHKVFKIQEALDGKVIYPGLEVNCRCTAVVYS